MGFTRWQWYYNKTQHTQIHISRKITHHVQTKHSTQSYTNIKGHITQNEYNIKSKSVRRLAKGRPAFSVVYIVCVTASVV
jgi:hypothetical protein